MPTTMAEAHAAQELALPAEPTVAELAENFAAAMERWARAGFRTVSREVYESRAAICDGCGYWQPKARLGLGKCAALGCGCTRFKRWLASERCPMKKW